MTEPKEHHMNAVVAQQPRAEPVTGAGPSLMEVIARLATDPAADIDKFERLMAMHERLGARDVQRAYDAAMSDAQEEMRPIATDANNPSTKSQYASYAALDRALRPIYTKHGFSLGFGTADGAPADHVRVTCRVAHRDGHRELEHIDMPTDGKGARGGDVMTRTHATGAAATYGQRYLLKLIFNIAVGDDNDNGGSVRDRSTGFEHAVAEINEAPDRAALVAWKGKNAALEQSLSTDEWNEIVRLVNRRAAALKGASK